MERRRHTIFFHLGRTEPRCARCPAAACAACPVCWPSTARLLRLVGGSTSVILFLLACGASVAAWSVFLFRLLARGTNVLPELQRLCHRFGSRSLGGAVFVYSRNQGVALPGSGEFSSLLGCIPSPSVNDGLGMSLRAWQCSLTAWPRGVLVLHSPCRRNATFCTRDRSHPGRNEAPGTVARTVLEAPGEFVVSHCCPF